MASRTIVFFLGIASSAWAQDPSQPRTKEGAAELIESLGHPDIEVRTRALAALRERVTEFESILRKNLSHSDPEIAGRCRDLLVDLDAQRTPRTFKGKVLHVDAKFNFLLINMGRQDGLSPGARFDVFRDPGNGLKPVQVATAEFEKYIGDDQLTSKLVIKTGRAADIRPDDLAIAIVPGPSGPGERAFVKPKPAAFAAPPPGAVTTGKIVLVHGEKALLATDLRRRDGIRIGDRLQVIREGKVVGTLEITDVQVWGSWAKPETDTLLETLKRGDTLEKLPE